MQMLVNSGLRHIEFGMIAGLAKRSCRPTQKIKAGMSAADIDSRAMFRGCRMVDVVDVIMAKTYESMAMHALAMITPIQSMSVLNLLIRSPSVADAGIVINAARKIIPSAHTTDSSHNATRSSRRTNRRAQVPKQIQWAIHLQGRRKRYSYLFQLENCW
jgi:hypothetical protein